MLLPDDLFISKKSCLSQLIEIYDKKKSSVIAVNKIDRKNIHKYGVIQSSNITDNIINIEDIVEYSKDFQTINSRLESLLIEANDISFDLESLSNDVIFDSEKLKKYEQKIAFLNHIKSKYGPTIKDVINHKESLKNQIIKSKNYDKEISDYESKINASEIELMNVCKEISNIRKKMALGNGKGDSGSVEILKKSKISFVGRIVNDIEGKDLRGLLDQQKREISTGIVLFFKGDNA